MRPSVQKFEYKAVIRDVFRKYHGGLISSRWRPPKLLLMDVNNSARQLDLFPLRVLVIDDDETALVLWDVILRRVVPDARIILARHELEATHAFTQALSEGGQFELVISDYYLGELQTGLDLWRKYARFAKQYLIVSGRSFDDFKKETAHLNSAPAYAEKDSGVMSLVGLVSNLLGVPIPTSE